MGEDLLPELGHGDLPEGFSAQPWVSVHFGQSLQVNDLLPYQEACPVLIGSFYVNMLAAMLGMSSVLHDGNTVFTSTLCFVGTDVAALCMLSIMCVLHILCTLCIL